MTAAVDPGRVALAAALLADAVLLLHAALVLFVVAGLPLVVWGNRRGWAWVNGWRFRGLHAAAIAVVVAQAWLGVDCPLTTLEVALRGAAGQRLQADGGFIAHWVGRLLYWDGPAWAFTATYTAFGTAVAAAWWRWPPQRRRPA